MADDTTLTIRGNLTADPELRFTPSGHAVANFTVASTPRTFDRQSGEWKDGETLFMRCTAWRHLGENTAESLSKGAAVLATGRLRQRTYETKTGESRTVVEMDLDDIGPSLRKRQTSAGGLDQSGRMNTGPAGATGSATYADTEPPF